jgi:hypothetical protein
LLLPDSVKTVLPVTPFHIIPATTIYFLFFRRLNGVAFFLGTFLIDLEPVLYLFFNIGFPQVPLLFGGYARQGFHMITHNPFSIFFLVAPAVLLLTKLIESNARGFLLEIFPGAEWMNYSWTQTYLSALFGAFLHLGWDLTMHYDINLGFPLLDIRNPFISFQAFYIILLVGLIMILPAYFIGKRFNRGSPFKKLP